MSAEIEPVLRASDLRARSGVHPRGRTPQPYLYDEASADYVGFWESPRRATGSLVHPFDRTLEWAAVRGSGSWAVKLNVAFNCLDRHVEAGLGDKVAYHWEGEPGDTRTLTYADLMKE